MKPLTLVTAWLVLANPLVWAEGKERYGQPLEGAEEVSVSTILQDPLAWQDKTVRITGTVREVCRKMGCWIDVEDASGVSIQVKVEDGVIVFPVSSVGRQVVAEGRVEVRELTREQYQEWIRHLAEEQGTTYDPSAIGEPPYRLVRLRGLGAEISR